MIVILIFTAFVVRCVFFNGGIRGSDAYAYARYSYESRRASITLDILQTTLGSDIRYLLQQR